jgi:hypothetical protein
LILPVQEVHELTKLDKSAYTLLRGELVEVPDGPDDAAGIITPPPSAPQRSTRSPARSAGAQRPAARRIRPGALVPAERMNHRSLHTGQPTVHRRYRFADVDQQLVRAAGHRTSPAPAPAIIAATSF